MRKAILLILFLTFLLPPLSGCGFQKTKNGGELTIAAFKSGEYFEYAARKYEEIHEGVSINITSYAGDEKDVSKYSQIINTALMSGKGEDIIDVSWISWTTLAEQDKLLDLNSEITVMPEAYYSNVLDAYLYNGKRYTIPLSFTFEAFQFDEAMADMENAVDLTLNRLLSLAEKYPNTALFNDSGLGMGRTTLAFKLFSMDFNDYVDVSNKKVNVDSENFISLLKNIKSIEERLAISTSGDISLIRQFLLYSPAMCSMGTLDYTNMFLMTNDKGESNFITTGILPAVNANSVNKELAIDFIRFLLSEEMQLSPEITACPVNKNAAAESAKYILANAIIGGYTPDGWGESNLERNIAIFDELVGKLALVEYPDDFIRDFAMTEMVRYFHGELSAEEAAKNLQSRLNTYLKE